MCKIRAKSLDNNILTTDLPGTLTRSSTPRLDMIDRLYNRELILRRNLALHSFGGVQIAPPLRCGHYFIPQECSLHVRTVLRWGASAFCACAGNDVPEATWRPDPASVA